jgi:hypothetical protein
VARAASFSASGRIGDEELLIDHCEYAMQNGLY